MVGLRLTLLCSSDRILDVLACRPLRVRRVRSSDRASIRVGSSLTGVGATSSSALGPRVGVLDLNFSRPAVQVHAHVVVSRRPALEGPQAVWQRVYLHT